MPRSDWYRDTDPRAMAVFLECLRRLTPSEKVNGMLWLTRMAFENSELAERRRHSEISEREDFLRVASWHLDRQTMIRAYGWDPERAGK